jgi:glycosyltransferase involved in cell wall biosynthesis
MPVLHLIDGHSPQACATTLALLAESFGHPRAGPQRLLILGPTALRRAAASAGIPLDRTDAVLSVGVPGGRALAGYFTARRRLPDLLAGDRVDLVHCWSLGALCLATLLFRDTPRVLTVTADPQPSGLRWLRSLARAGPRGLALLPISATLRRTLLGAGIPEPLIHVLAPGIDLGRASSADRTLLRQRWGATDPQIRIVALLSDPPHAADSLDAILAVNLAAESQRAGGYELRLLIHPEQRHRRRAQNVAAALGHPQRIVVEEALAQPWEVLAGCDLALAQGPHAGGLSLRWALAAGAGIVADATDPVSEAVEDHHGALLAKPGSAKALAHRMTQMLADPALAYRLRDTARNEAYRSFSRQRYVEALQGVYEPLAAGRPVAVAAPA